MAVIVRYAFPEVQDAYICKGRLPGGIWQTGQQGGRENALQFANEGCAKSYLALHNYDLPANKLTFEAA